MKSFWRSSFLTLLLVAVDAMFLSSGWTLAYRVRESLNPMFARPINPIDGYMEALPVLVVVWLAILARFGFYRHHERIAGLNRPGPIVWAVFWMVLAVALYNVARKPDFSRAAIAFFALGAVAYLFASRTLFRIAKRIAIESGHGCVRALIVGTGDLARETLSRAREHPDIGFRLVGLIAPGVDAAWEPGEIEGCPVRGGLGDIVTQIRRCRVEEVFVAVDNMGQDDLFDLIERTQREVPVIFKVVANILYVIANRAKVDDITGLPVIAFPGSTLTPAQAAAKRAFDLIFGTALATLLLPLAGLFAIIIRLDSPGPVLFVHERVGRGGKPFRMYKFRTMRVDADPYAPAPENQQDDRVTRFGRFLRRTSLDEMPQVLNVLRGEMSLVGPRPEMPFIAEGYSPWQRARLSVKPGLTGLWQVAGRKNLPLHHNLEYDYHYVKNQSLALDVEIMARTVPAVLLGRGAY